MELLRLAQSVGVQTPAGIIPVGWIIGIGRNYADHAREQQADIPARPMVFYKSPYSACLDGDQIVIPRACQDREQVDYEGELCVILGRTARDVPLEQALEHVLGYCCANDVSARWWQREGSGGQFCRGKSFDTFCPLGPRVASPSEVGDPQSLRLRTRLNGEVVQDASTRQMLFSVATLIADLSRGTTLPAGTAILTGTPAGVGMSRTPPRFLREGDLVEVEIERVGVLRNRVRLEPQT